MNAMRVATLFSDSAVESCTVAALHAHGVHVTRQADILTLLTSVRRGGVDAAVIEDNERQLPQWMSALQCHGAALCPTIIVGPGDAGGIARALQFGAADYAAISEGLASIAARLQAHVQLSRERANSGLLRVGNYTLQADLQIVSHGEHHVRLTRREFSMAWLLFRHCGRAVNLRMLSSEVWGREVELSKRSIEQHAYRLRRKLTEGLHRPPGEPRIHAVYGVGYRLDGV